MILQTSNFKLQTPKADFEFWILDFVAGGAR